MPFCPKCGKDIKEDQNYCDNCGKKLTKKNYVCDFCDKTFQSKDRLKKHQLTHSIFEPKVMTSKLKEIYYHGKVRWMFRFFAYLFIILIISGVLVTSILPDKYYTVEQYNELRDKYNKLVDEYNQLEEDYTNIPSTPAMSGVDYRLYGGPSGKASQIAIEHTNLTLTGLTGTGSMSPGISSQSMVIGTTSFNSYTLTPGQIISYEPEEEGDQINIMHRIYSVNQTGEFCYETKGDANFYSDPECVKPEQIERLVIGVIFRKPGEEGYCKEEIDYGPSSQYCPG